MSDLKDLRQAMGSFARRWRYVPGFNALVGTQSELERQRFERKWLDKKGEVVQSKADRIRLYYIQDCVWEPAPDSTPEKPIGLRRMFTEDDLNDWITNDVDGQLTRVLMAEIKDFLDIDKAELEGDAKN